MGFRVEGLGFRVEGLWVSRDAWFAGYAEAGPKINHSLLSSDLGKG